MKKVSIKIPYFSAGLKWTVGPLFLALGGWWALVSFHGFSLILIGLGFALVSTYYVYTIDAGKKQIRDSFVFMFIPFPQETIKYETIDKIVITKERVEYNANTRSRTRSVSYNEYTATIQYNGGRAFEFLTKIDREDLLRAIYPAAKALRALVEDHTTGTPFRINMKEHKK